MTVSDFRIPVAGLVFVFKSACLALKQVPTCIRKPKTNTFDKSIKLLHWLFLVVLDGFRLFYMDFRSFQVVFRSFQIVLGCFRLFQIFLVRFSSLLTLVSTQFFRHKPLVNFFNSLFTVESNICIFLCSKIGIQLVSNFEDH